MSSPQLPAWDAMLTPPQRLSFSDSASSPTLSVTSKTFSSSRLSGSTSTLASSPAFRDSLDFSGTGKFTLSQVREEPTSLNIGQDSVATSEPFFGHVSLPQDESGLYNFDDSPAQSLYNIDHPSPKKARSGDSYSSTLSATPSVSKRFGSISKKFKTRTGVAPKLSIDVAASKPARSRTSSAASTIMNPGVMAISQGENHLPPSPARTLFEEPIQETMATPIAIDTDKANIHQEDEVVQARTPLLPPMLIALSSQHESPVQSPLQSPTVADSPVFPDAYSPADRSRGSSLPSPPLSTKPSLVSLRQRSRAGTMVTSADIPPMILDADEDSWSAKLGHANFTIFPEPYLPSILNIEACRRFREDYGQARMNFSRHLARTGEVSGPTSRVYKLTEEKWVEVDAQWKLHNNVITRAVDEMTQQQDAVMVDLSPASSESVPIPQIPASDLVTGKFPVLADDDIIGPMSVAPALKRFISNEHSLRNSKKRSFLRFMSDLWTHVSARP